MSRGRRHSRRYRRILVALLVLVLPAGSLAPDDQDLPGPSARTGNPPRFETVQAEARSSETVLLDRRGEAIHRLRTDPQRRLGSWVPLDAISAALPEALLLSEDRRFFEHSGVDWQAVAAAAWSNLRHAQVRGASTLSMQLASLLDPALRPEHGGSRSLLQKLAQAQAAWRLERHWRKTQILEAYLNLVPFRGELVGVDALSRTLFGKAPHALTASEAALAAALVRAPNAAPAQVAHRACALLKTMQGQADCAQLRLQATLSLQHARHWQPSEGNAPHLMHLMIRQQIASTQGTPLQQAPVLHPAGSADASGALPNRLHSTLDAQVQRAAIDALMRQLRELQGRRVADGAVIVLDNASGEVLAWVGSSQSLSQAAEVDGVLAQRQPGSTLKPFLYGQAIAENRLTAASLLNDSPAHLSTTDGLYIPRNHDGDFKGWVSVRTALGASLNIPAVRALQMLSPEAFHRQLQQLGLRLPESASHYGYSLALGSAEVSLLQLSNAYRTLANGGRHCPVYWWRTAPGANGHAGPQPRTPDCRQAIDPGAAFIVGNMLSDPQARLLSFGTDSVLNTRFWSAVKTGTSKDMRDNWTVGWSQHYTVGVWVGNANGEPMHEISGAGGAAPIWAAIMRTLHAHVPSRPPLPPSGLQAVSVRFAPPIEPARQEWFLPGTAQTLFALQSPPVRITTPAPGSIVALDPDIPAGHQRLSLRAQGEHADGQRLRWRIGERIVGHGPQAEWLPLPGRHEIELLDAEDQALDRVRIEVRGAMLASPPAGAPEGTSGQTPQEQTPLP